MSKYYTVVSVAEAWEQANRLMPTDYIKDDRASDAAGYPIYRSTVPELCYCWISDLGDRLEVNLQDGSTVNVWIEDVAKQAREQDALDQIRTIVDRLDPDGCVASALYGCLDMAQDNIDQQYCRSMMQERDDWQRWCTEAEKRANDNQDLLWELDDVNAELRAELAEACTRVTELEQWQRTMRTTLRSLI